MCEQMGVAVAASICGVSSNEKFLIQRCSKEMARNIISGSDNKIIIGTTKILFFKGGHVIL